MRIDVMKLSEELQQYHKSGDFGNALEGLTERAAQLEDALKDARSALLYVREVHGELYGVGFDRVEKKASAALDA
jgi:hypothetical protein